MLKLPSKQTLFSVLFVVIFLLSIFVKLGIIPESIKICAQADYPNPEDCTTDNILYAPFWWAFRTINYYGGLITALATVAIGWFTFTLWQTSIEQGALTRQALKISKDTLSHTQDADVTTQRAYLSRQSIGAVDLKQFLTDDGKKIARFEYTPVWENNGATPAINVKFCAINPIICVEEPNKNFTPIEIEMGELPRITIGARQTMSGGSVAIPINDLIQCSNQKCKIFLIFRLEYNDVFRDTPLRVVQYCEELRFNGFAPISDVPIPIGGISPFTLYGYPRFQIYS